MTDTAEPPSGPMARLRAWVKAVRESVFLRRWWKELLVLFALLLTLAAPFVLKPKESTAPRKYDRRIVILTPHNEKIRHEFGLAFARHWKEKRGEVLYVDWRVAGTSEISLMMRSDYAAAFEQFWKHRTDKKWSPLVASSFGNAKVSPAETLTDDTPLDQYARRTFLESEVSIGVDLFFGGGSFDFEQQAGAGTIVASTLNGSYGLKEVFAKHPEWFRPESIPQHLSGETFYDPEMRWVGTCLSSMGIVYNRDVLERLGIDKEPAQWADLADPRYSGQIALSDPNKSGTVTKALEQLIQQQMHLEIERVRQNPGSLRSEKEIVDAGLAAGWERGLQLILRISANSRYFTDNATKIPLEVAQGDAAAGMCVDFYGRSFEEQCRKPDGSTRVAFISPRGGASVSVDPVAMLRGAPDPEVATAFMEFVLSDAGQRIWNFQPGSEGGPEKAALRRLPVRQEFYTEENRRWMTDSNAQPFEDAKAFTYHREWTGSLFNVIRLVVRAMCIDVHKEQKRAWHMLVRTNFPPHATRMFEEVKVINYAAAQQFAANLNRKDKDFQMKKARELSDQFRMNYERAYEFAMRGE